MIATNENVTVRDVLHYNMALCVELLTTLKDTAFKTEKRKKWGFLSKDKSVVYGSLLPEGVKIADAVWSVHEFDVVIGYMNPKNPNWVEYRGLKREITKLMIALRIVKIEGWEFIGSAAMPVFSASTGAAVRAHRYNVPGILTRMRKILIRIKDKKKDFGHVAAWKREYEERRIAQRKEAQPAHV